LVISVVYRGCAIPVALGGPVATEKTRWRRDGSGCSASSAGNPKGWTVIVLADRGLYARWLFRRITRLGWHPFFAHQHGRHLSA